MKREEVIKLVDAFYSDEYQSIESDLKGNIYLKRIQSDWDSKGIFEETDIKLSLDEARLLFEAFVGATEKKFMRRFMKNFIWYFNHLKIRLGGNVLNKFPMLEIKKI